MNDFSVTHFAVGFAALVVNGYIVRLVAGIWLSDDKSKIAAFAFLLGSVGVSKLGYDGGAGSVLGLVVLWWLFFKREKEATQPLAGAEQITDTDRA